MKAILIILAGLSLSACSTVKPVVRQVDQAYANVAAQHSDEEWATYWRCNETIFKEWSENTIFPWTGAKLETLSETFGERADHWENK